MVKIILLIIIFIIIRLHINIEENEMSHMEWYDKENTELINFFMDNITEIPYKIMKRSRYWMWYDKHQTTYFRDHFRLSPESKADLLKIKNK